MTQCCESSDKKPTNSNTAYILAIDNITGQNNLRNLVNFTTREDAMLDVLLTDTPEYNMATKLAPIASNDHCCILLHGVPYNTKKYRKTTKRCITQQSKLAVYKSIALETWEAVLGTPDVHQKVEAFHKTIDRILDTHCPKRCKKCRQDRPPWITNCIMKLIHAREKAYKKRCKSWKVLRALVQRRIRSAKRSFINNELNNTQNTKEWWNTLNSLTKKATRTDTRNLLINGKFLTTQEFADGINSYYTSVGGDVITLNDTQEIADILQSSRKLDDISLSEIKVLLNKLDKTKATSTEDYPTWLSVECIEDICIPIHNIINCRLNTRTYPDKWKRAQVIPIPKCNNPAEYKQYRPISLLFHIGKLAEEVIINKLSRMIAKIIKPSQYAYRPNVNTTDALLQYVDDYTKLLDKHNVKFMQSACLDFSKAFDRLQPSILISKMKSYDFNANVIDLVSSFLTDRVQCVKFSNHFSSYKKILVGSPQGTKLGPILWLIYVNDLEIDGFTSLKYADDTTFYKPSFTHVDTDLIGEAITKTAEWSSNNSMLLNPDKTVVMNTSLSYIHKYDSNISIHDVTISPSENTKFLGVFIDTKLNFNSHIEYLVSKTNSRLFLMRQLKVQGLNNNGLKTFYTTNIRSILLHGAPAWYSLLSTHNKVTLECIQRSATRIILPDLDYEHRLTVLLLPKLNDFIFECCKTHFNKICCNEDHPLFSRVIFNNLKMSSRTNNTNTIYRLDIARTQKRAKSFFQFFMRFFNNGNLYLES